MKIIIKRADLLAALSHVVGVVHRNSNIPILNNVLLSAENDTLTVRATDLDMQAVTSCPAEIQTAGVLTVDAQRLKEIASSAAPGSQLSFEMGDGDDPRLLIKSGRSRFRLPVLSPDQFPAIPDDKYDAEIKISAPDLSEILEAALMSVSTEVVRYYLCGVFLTIQDGRLRAVATNGHHLTYRDGPKTKAKFDGVILPTKAVSEIVKAVKDRADGVSLRVSKNIVAVEVGGYTFQTKTIDGSFPDYQRVIPAPPKNVARLDSESVLIALRRAQIATEDKARAVLLDFSKGSLTVRGRGQAEASDEVEIDYNGEPATLSFNSSYVTSILGRATGMFEVRFGGPVDHTTWRIASDDDGLTVMLPIRQGAQ